MIVKDRHGVRGRRSMDGRLLIQNGNPPTTALDPCSALDHSGFWKGVPSLFAEAQSFVMQDHGSRIGHKAANIAEFVP